MELTPASLRLDLKCGKGAISKGEKCTKGPATRAKSARSKKAKAKSAKAQQNLRKIAMVGGLSVGVALAVGIAKANRNRNRAHNSRMLEFAREGRTERRQQQAAESLANAQERLRRTSVSARPPLQAILVLLSNPMHHVRAR